MKKWLKPALPDFLAVLLGALLTLAFAPFEIFPFAIIAPAGLLALWLKSSPKRAFWLGFLFGLGLFSTSIYWVFHSIHVIGDVPSGLAYFITGGLIAILALYPALTGYFLNRWFYNSTTKILCAFPAMWVFGEWIRSWMFTGFPWLFVGYSQTNSPLKGFAPLLSVYGVSLAALLSSALLVNAIIKLRQKSYQQVYFHAFAILFIWIAGSVLNLIAWTEPHGKPVSVSLVQGNIPQKIKWSSEYVQLSLDRYEELTQSLWAKDQIIIWPEAAIPKPLQYATTYINALDEKAKKSGAHLILGIPIQAADQPGYYNAIVTLGSERKVYLKRRLVPFGEYVPFQDILSNVFNFMNIPISALVPGSFAQQPFEVGGVKILPSICYEIAFPELFKSNDHRLDLLLTVTNDAWFGESSAQAQHLQMAAMRAMEFRRPIIFASNDGITAVIGPDGTIESKAPQRETFVLKTTVQPMNGLTPWMRFGMDPILLILMALFMTAIRSNRALARQNANQQTLLQEERP